MFSVSAVSGDGNVSFEEFVEIVSNIGASETAPTDQDQEEQELRDAFRVRLPFIFSPLFLGTPRFSTPGKLPAGNADGARSRQTTEGSFV